MSEADELWQRVLADWNDEQAHDRFVDHCRATQQLTLAAARYKAAVDGTDHEYRGRSEWGREAQQRLVRIGFLALAELHDARKPPGRFAVLLGDKRFRRALIVLVVLAMMVGLAFLRR